MPKRHSVLTAFGLNVRRQRDARKLTQEELAEKASLHPTYLSGIERGIRNPSLLIIARIAKASGPRFRNSRVESTDEPASQSHHQPRGCRAIFRRYFRFRAQAEVH